MGVQLRPARDTDSALIIDALQMAARGQLPRGPWDFAFPDAAERARGLAQISGGAERSFCHRSVFRVAELAGTPSAALCAFDASQFDAGALGRALFAAFAALAFAPERSASVLSQLAAYAACFPDMPPHTWIVENVATRPEARRRGLVAALLDDALEAGRRAGLASAQISVLIGNDAAQLAYERAGFRVVETRSSEAFERLMGTPGFSRMTLVLDGRNAR